MSHEITSTDSLVLAGQGAWHGLGTVVKDTMTATEALLKSGLTWQIGMEPIYNNEGSEIEGFKAVKRMDTKEVFQIASNRYTPVQNADCFKIFDEVVGTGMAKYEVAGSLQGGRKVWILARIPSLDFSLANGKDQINSYLLLTTSHDGSLSFQMFKTPIRVVCMNTLRASLAGKGQGKVAYYKHTVNFRSRVSQAQIILSETRDYFLRFKEASELLARKQMRQLEVDSFLDKLLNIGNVPEEVSTKAKNVKLEIDRLYHDGRGNQMDGVRGTAWALYNGVTEYVDWERSTKGDESNRLASSWYGSGAGLREKAFEDLLVLAR